MATGGAELGWVGNGACCINGVAIRAGKFAARVCAWVCSGGGVPNIRIRIRYGRLTVTFGGVELVGGPGSTGRVGRMGRTAVWAVSDAVSANDSITMNAIAQPWECGGFV